MPEFPPEMQDLINRMLTVDPAKRITIEQIKTHPAFYILLPTGYQVPTPLPIPSLPDPIDPSTLTPPVFELLRQVGFSDNDELNRDLLATHHTVAKGFCYLIHQAISFDSLPWESESLPSGYINKPSLANFSQKFSFSTSNSPTFIKSQTIMGINMALPDLNLSIQNILSEKQYKWFFPCQLQFIAKKQETILIIDVEFSGESTMNIYIRLYKGSEHDFDDLYSSIASKIQK